MAPANTEIARTVASIARGLISDAEAAAILVPARKEKNRIEAELATADTVTNVVELHPQAVQRFADNLEALAAIIANKEALPIWRLPAPSGHWSKAL
jgi:hypothetical protein